MSLHRKRKRDFDRDSPPKELFDDDPHHVGDDDDDDELDFAKIGDDDMDEDNEDEDDYEDDDEDEEHEDEDDEDDQPLDLDIPEYFDERTKKRIKSIEEENLSEKPWQLKGEVSARTRPENSLLDELVKFERTTRVAPEITEETTKSIHEIIRQRIKDNSWDDPIRKVKPKEKSDKYKRRIEVSQEKSKLGLAELYAQEFAKQKSGDEKVEDPEQVSVKKKLKSLFTRIDALLVYKE